jgi:hypothetical protein
MKIDHPWLNNYPIDINSKGLIIGTHPPMPYRGCMPFFYGNMNEFWKLLEKVYPCDNFFDDEGKPEILFIKKWIQKYDLSITDMVKFTTNSFSVDEDMEIERGVGQLNDDLFNSIKESNITTIYFTSFGNGKSAYGLFRRWYKNHFKKTLDSGNNIINSEAQFILINIFNRNIKLVMLYSPSPAARRGIPRSKPYIKWLDKDPKTKNSIDEFRVFWYKKSLPISRKDQ